MPASVVGRDSELAAIEDFLAGIPERAAVLALEGEAGMGKTTLWKAGIDAAEAGGLRVLRAQLAESETTLTFTGLGDLLDPVLEEVLEPLAAAQRSALARALVLEETVGPPPDARAVGVALLNVLRGLAAGGDVLVAVDDVQWLDAASSAAIGYAARRLVSERIGLLLARRTGIECVLLDELRRSAPTVDLDVGPLDMIALHRVVHAQLDVSLPRPLLAEVHQASGGNPFYALELVRTLIRSGVSVEAGRALPVPDSLHGLVHGRLLELPEESRDFLAAAAAHAHPTISITERACGVERAVGLAPAVDARIVATEGERIRFTHPLLAAGALELADPVRRIEIHARLAELLEDPEARAWQLAASVDRPDDGVAAVLEQAADHARMRGAPRPAALLLDCAAQLTPTASADDAVRRAVDAAFLHFEAGDSRRADAKLRDVVAPLPPGPLRARALVVLARIRLYDAPDEARALFLQVIEETDDPHTSGVAHEGLSACSVWLYERFDEALASSDLALAVADDLGDEALAADVLMTRLGTETLLGRTTAAATAERALALQESAGGARVLDQPLVALAEYWTWIDLHERARTELEHLLRHANEVGDENARPFLLCLLGDAERALGNLDRALVCAQEGRDAAEQSGQPLFDVLNRALESVVHAQAGRVEEARHAAHATFGRVPERHASLIAAAALGHLELARAEPRAAVGLLEPHVAFVRQEGIVEPGATTFVVDQIEALIDLGRDAEAEELLGWYEANARRLERVSACANCARLRGLLAAQRGDPSAALAAFEEALELHALVRLPLDRGRTLLALGVTQRRLKRRREARATLEDALAVFEGMGAALWAGRVRAELKRISGRAATPGALTPAEERVAALVAEGKTNKEVAAALFVSERTVEGHLAHIFGKLGVRNRREIASVLALTQTQVAASSETGGDPVSAESPSP